MTVTGTAASFQKTYLGTFCAFSLIAFLALGSGRSLASSPSMGCEQNLLSYSPQEFEAALQEVPGLSGFILKMMDDPLVPLQIKKIIKSGLQPSDLSKRGRIRLLTKKLRNQWSIKAKIKAFSLIVETPYKRFENSFRGALANGKLQNDENFNELDEFGPFQGIAVPDRPYDESTNDLILLIHELAHWHFESFLVRHLPRMARKLPPGLVFQGADGTYYLNSELRDLLHERYAAEIELKALLATHGREGYSPFWSPLFSERLKNETPLEVARQIAMNVVRGYKIKDVQVLAIATLPLSKILLGFVPEAFEVEKVRLYLGDLYETLDENEFKILYYFTCKAMIEKGMLQARFLKIEYYDALVALIRMIEKRDGRQRITALNKIIVRRFKDLPEVSEKFLELINAPLVRRALEGRGKWILLHSARRSSRIYR